MKKKQSNAVKQRKISVNADKRRMRERATIGSLPYSFEEMDDIGAFDSYRDIETHISKLFPLVLKLVADGWSIPKIERRFKFRDRLLVLFLQRHTSLNEYVKASRSLREDVTRESLIQ